MREMYDKQLIDLNNQLIEMGTMIEEAIQNAVTAFMKQDASMAQKAIEADVQIDHQEKEIETLCLRLLLLQQPVAGDLRQVSAALKMITDMERIGDHAADISELTLLMSKAGTVDKPAHIQTMANETIVMLVDSIEAFVSRDLEKARQVIEHDDIVDDLFLQVRNEVVEMIRSHCDQGEQATDFLMTAKYLERIGDHATNISEWVIFSITGSRREEE